MGKTFRVKKLVTEFSLLSRSRVETYGRIQQLLNSYAKLKDDLAQNKDNLVPIERRMDKVTSTYLNKNCLGVE